jgi:hypothetical protein
MIRCDEPVPEHILQCRHDIVLIEPHPSNFLDDPGYLEDQVRSGVAGSRSRKVASSSRAGAGVQTRVS